MPENQTNWLYSTHNGLNGLQVLKYCFFTSAKAPNNRLRPSCPEPSRSNTTSPASGNTQDLRKKSSKL